MRWTQNTLFILLLIPTLTGCSLVRGRASSPSSPGIVEPEARDRDVGSDEAARITSGVVETALEAIGTPYVWGGTGENGFDCSGLIQYSYGEFGIRLPRVSTDQLRVGRQVETNPSSLRRGDILGFSGKVGGKSTHVGLYVGNGEFIHSSSSGVRVSDLANPYWLQHFIEARRVVW
jgi:cell wall-associated NlpC family hydrolase